MNELIVEIVIIIATLWALASSIATVTVIVRATEERTARATDRPVLHGDKHASQSTARAAERRRP